MSDDRKLAVLRAIIEDYVTTREPVGSKALVERHGLGVSPATIRNDMALLEEEGLIAQPHTSAGRVPTDAGYRLFVDRLSTIKPLSTGERRAIETVLAGAVDLDDVMDRTVRTLATLTRQVAVVQYPSLSGATVRHVELVSLGPGRLLLVLITSTGRVEQRTIEVGSEVASDLSDQVVAELRARLNDESAGKTVAGAMLSLTSVVEAFAPADQAMVESIVEALQESLAVQREDRVVLAGTAHLARAGMDFRQSLDHVLEAIEEHVVLLRLLSEMIDDPSSGVSVRIGRELSHEGLVEASIVSSGYGPGEAARLGVLGPTRMDYPTTIAAVRAVARYVSKAMEG
ncbi:MAG: heat-inducible transcriptional repressor HrcA [Actinomycetales bacterium]